MSPLCNGLAVPLIRHLHPLHRRHVSTSATNRNREYGGPEGQPVEEQCPEKVSRWRRVSVDSVSVLLWQERPNEMLIMAKIVLASC